MTSGDSQVVQEALAHARAGRATLPQLAAAHELACAEQKNGDVGELREHIRRMVPAPPARTEVKAVVLGILSGVLTHYLLKSMSKRRSHVVME